MGSFVTTAEEATQQRAEHPGALLIALTRIDATSLVQLRINIADPALRSRVEGALRGALADAERAPVRPRIWKFSTERRARALGGLLRGTLVMLRVSEENAGRLRRMVALVESYGAVGVQLVCPPSMTEKLERVTFRILEERRGQPGRPPLVLATTEEPVEILLRNLEARP